MEELLDCRNVSPADLTVGLDEVGRGPLVGNVLAAAVILDPDTPIEGLADSKKLTPRRRRILAQIIAERALAVGIGRATPAEIDKINILQASLLAMQRAYFALTPNLFSSICLAQIDGKFCPKLPCPVETIIKGDSKVSSISAASIIAKVTRDDEMIELAKQFPEYGFERHKGYPTTMHIKALNTYGPLPCHRFSFAPVRAAKTFFSCSA